MSQLWEARSLLRYGSKFQGRFHSEEDARKFAEAQIAKHGNVGRIESVVGRVVYYDIYEHEEL